MLVPASGGGVHRGTSVPVIGGTRTIGNDHENKSINNEGVCGGVFGSCDGCYRRAGNPLVELHLYLIKVLRASYRANGVT